jgi:putative Holliday junction resolvase
VYYTLDVKLMGIDYGAKRVGIASTDESGEFAIPRAVVPNDEKLLLMIVDSVKKYGVEKIVIGESKNYTGQPNEIMKETNIFADALREKGIDVVLHPEVLTSMEADQLQGQTPMRDASAAAIILKNYIDTINNTHK